MKFYHFWPHAEKALWLPFEKSDMDTPGKILPTSMSRT